MTAVGQLGLALGMLAFLCSLSFAAQQKPNSPANVPKAEIVWTGSARDETRLIADESQQSQISHRLLYQKFINRSWQPAAEVIYESPHPIATPSLATKESGEKILIWTEQVAGKAHLNMMLGQSLENSDYSIEWAEVKRFSDLGRFNMAPSIVIDLDNKAWVFWAADVSDYSDIYYVKETDQGWTKPQRVNEVNNVPDHSPFGKLTAQGEVVVEWQTYDHATQRYQLASRAFLGENSSFRELSRKLSGKLSSKEQSRIDEFQLPDFLPSDQRVLVHFPANRLLQSRKPKALSAMNATN